MTTTLSTICKKRLLGDIKLLKKDPHKYIDVSPDEHDLLTWYFLVKGPEISDFTEGYFIGKIMHDPEYPFKPPNFMMLTPNGRFDIEKKICLSNSSYHSNEWSAMWTIHAILTGFLSIMLDDKDNGISHIHLTKNEREVLAKKSVEYNKKHYPDIIRTFTRFIDENGNPRIDDFAVAQQPTVTSSNEVPKVEPPKAEPPKVEPPKAEPPKVEPPKAEPPKVEPPKVEPLKVEPLKVEPPKVEPPKVEHPKVEPSKVEPLKVASPVEQIVELINITPVDAPIVETKEVAKAKPKPKGKPKAKVAKEVIVEEIKVEEIKEEPLKTTAKPKPKVVKVESPNEPIAEIKVEPQVEVKAELPKPLKVKSAKSKPAKVQLIETEVAEKTKVEKAKVEKAAVEEPVVVQPAPKPKATKKAITKAVVDTEVESIPPKPAVKPVPIIAVPLDVPLKVKTTPVKKTAKKASVNIVEDNI